MKANNEQAVAIDLTAFGDESADIPSGNVAGESNTATSGETTGIDDSTQSSQNVVYGIQDDNTTAEDTSQPPEIDDSKQETFDELIKGKYKTDFSEKVQGIINERFKESKQLNLKSLSKWQRLYLQSMGLKAIVLKN